MAIPEWTKLIKGMLTEIGRKYMSKYSVLLQAQRGYL